MTTSQTDITGSQLVGWREWVALPDFGIARIKAKLDTGARTSALDVESWQVFEQDGRSMVRFDLRYGTPRKPQTRECVAPLVEIRQVKDSGGHEHNRAVIRTRLAVGGDSRVIEMTLSSRSDMKFRMLIGRSAMENLLVDPGRSYLTGKRKNVRRS